MRERIYKFLDEYVGEGANCKLTIPAFGRTWTDNWEVLSNNGTLIIWFQVRHDEIKIYRSDALCKKIEGYFSVDPDESWKYIRDWFGIRNNIKVLSDLLKLTIKNENV